MTSDVTTLHSLTFTDDEVGEILEGLALLHDLCEMETKETGDGADDTTRIAALIDRITDATGIELDEESEDDNGDE